MYYSRIALFYLVLLLTTHYSIIGTNAQGSWQTGELNNLPFNQLLGGPMVAAIRSQAASAYQTLAFVKGLEDPTTKQLINVDFIYDSSSSTGVNMNRITVPLLAILPIPYLRIKSLIIDLSVKLVSVDTTKSTTTTSGSYTQSSYNWWRGSSSSVSVSSQSTSTYGVNITKQYSYEVILKAVQDEMPAGLARILDIIEEDIVLAPKTTTTPNQNSGSSLDDDQI